MFGPYISCAFLQAAASISAAVAAASSWTPESTFLLLSRLHHLLQAPSQVSMCGKCCLPERSLVAISWWCRDVRQSFQLLPQPVLAFGQPCKAVALQSRPIPSLVTAGGADDEHANAMAHLTPSALVRNAQNCFFLPDMCV